MALCFDVDTPPVRADGYLAPGRRVGMYETIITRHAPDRPLKVLEIGVFQASLSHYLMTKLANRIASYTGVDPYLTENEVTYLRGYWNNDPAEVIKTYEASKLRFEAHGATLLRQTSTDFLASAKDRYDVIIVDGDHSEAACLSDLRGAWRLLEPGGLLLCDDFGNPDHPGVTRAATLFDRQISKDRAEYGTSFTFFQKKGMRDLPFPLGVIWWRR